MAAATKMAAARTAAENVPCGGEGGEIAGEGAGGMSGKEAKWGAGGGGGRGAGRGAEEGAEEWGGTKSAATRLPAARRL
jgi:hypothetical protein